MALIAGSRGTALRHVGAAIAADPLWMQPYLHLLACGVPKRLLRFAAGLRGRVRLLAAYRRRPPARASEEPVAVADE